MTREQAKQNLISIGVEEPTEDQISNYLNQLNGETQKEKDKAKQYKEKAEKADELQEKIDELEAGNLTELEKANKALETANKQIAEMQKSNAIRDQREAAMTNFKITADQSVLTMQNLERLCPKKKRLRHRQRNKRLLKIRIFRAAAVMVKKMELKVKALKWLKNTINAM